TEHIYNTNSINTVSSPVSTAGPSFANIASPSPINAAGTPASNNAFSPFKNVFSFLHVPIVTPINDTGIFGNAYDDEAVEEEVGMNNAILSYTIPDAPLTKFLNNHPKDQVIGNIETPMVCMFERLLQQERQTEHIYSTNSINTVSSPVSTARPSFANIASPSPINAAGTPAKTLTFLILVHGNLQHALKDKGVIDTGCSRHMTGNVSYLSDFEAINGGYVAFGGNLKGEDITYSDDEEDVGVEADFTNLEITITVSLILTTRVRKDHPFSQIIGDLSSGPLTRSMTRIVTDEGFKDPDYLDKVYKVVKALYGLHQAPRAWHETLANYLLENGFQRGKIDQTLFIKRQKGDILLVHVYVDDIIFGSTNKDLCKAFEKLMKDKF
nr:putative ribonuclease H-like domain-containing protein [Tanacetum cinerariifolium]